VKLWGLLDASGGSRLFTNDDLSGYINKLAFADLFLADCFMQLVREGVEDDNLVPGGFTSLVVDCEGEAPDVLLTTGAEPGITAEPALQLDFSGLLSLRRAGRTPVSPCDVI
jgi:hypothetical protein